MSDRIARRPSYTVCDGFRIPMDFPIEGLVSGQRYRPGPTDIFVSTYPKCGTTWTQYIIYLLVNHGQPLAASQSINDVFPHLEEVGEAVVRALPEPRLIKTHLPLPRAPWDGQARYVLVARNPFDCAVSFFHHTRGFPRHYDFADGTWDTFFECFISGEVDFGDYFDHLLSWWPKRSEPNVLFLTYEGMLEAPRAAVRSIAAFLGGSAAEALQTPELIDRVVEHSRFDNMRLNQRRWASQRPVDMPEFVRKGVVGDWANYFSPQQARRLAGKLTARLSGTGAELLWPDLVAAATQA